MLLGWLAKLLRKRLRVEERKHIRQLRRSLETVRPDVQEIRRLVQSKLQNGSERERQVLQLLNVACTRVDIASLELWMLLYELGAYSSS